MINNWKLGLKSLEYAYGITSNFILMIIFGLMGLVFYIIGPGIHNTFMGGYMLMCTAILPTQMVYSLSMSNIVQSSPMKKKMQTTIPAAFTCGNLMIMYLINAVIRGIMVWAHPETALAAGKEVLLLALVIMMMSVYLALAFKYFMVSIIMFIAVYFSIFRGMNAIVLDWFESGAAVYMAMIILGLAFVAVGGIAQYLCSLLVYKVPMSKMAQASLIKNL